MFENDPDELKYQGLIDSGSLHTLAPLSAFEGIDLGEPDLWINKLYFGMWHDKHIPLCSLDLRLVAPAPWSDIHLPATPVAVVDVPLPFLVLGSSALNRLAVLIRDADQRVHVKPIGMFHGANHYQDKAF